MLERMWRKGNPPTLLVEHHSLKALILQCSSFFTVQLSRPYMTAGKTIALTRETFVSEVTSLLFNMVSRLFKRRQWHPTPVLLPGKSHGRRSLEGCSPWGRWGSDTTERLHFHFPALEKEMATHSSVLARRIPGTGEPGGMPSMGSHRVGHNWSDLAAAAVGWS